MSLKQTVMSGLRWSAGMRLLAQLFTWTVTIIVIRLLSPADYGLMAMAGVFIAFFSMISEMGLGSAIVQRQDLNDEEIRTIFGFILAVSLFLSVSLILMSPLIARYYGEPQLIKILWALSLIFLLSGLAVVPRSMLLKRLEYKKIATLEFVSAIAGSICTFVMALAGMGVWSLVGGFLAIRLSMMIVSHSYFPFICLPKMKIKGMRKIFIFSGQITLSRILWYIYTSAAATLIVGKILGKEMLGLYGVALLIACLPMEKVGGIINQIAFPAFSTIQDNPSLAGQHFLRAVRVLCFIAFPVFWGISSIASEIVHIFLGGRWIESIIPLQIIALVVPLRMVRNLMNPALTGLGRADIDLINEFVGVVLIPIAFFAATRWGLIGVSFVWLFVFPVVFIINLECTRKVLSLRFADVYREMWRPALASVVMYVAVTMVKKLDLSALPELVSFSTYIAIGAIGYIGATLLINREITREIVFLFKK